MTKRSLRGLATGILLTTIVFALQTKPVEEIQTDETEVKVEDIVNNYLAEEQLIAISVEEYEMLNTKKLELEQEQPNSAGNEEPVIVREIHFTVEPGMSSGEVAILLERAGIIEDSLELEKHIINSGLEGKIKSGEYVFTNQMSIKEIVEILS
ncbi:MAG: endolytic transglycosylase MltG [Bacillaceae bacterium]|nr:endolytic transglycosylase MltG [Bacillaceae bacterium]